MSYGNVIATVRCKIQLVEITLFSLRQTGPQQPWIQPRRTWFRGEGAS